MVFDSQFSLGLEITRLAPINLIAAKTAEAVMNIARDLRNSGSDIIVEEDLASLFGRCRITANMSSSFRAQVVQPGPSYFLCENISIENRPGPTLSRSLLQAQNAYFSTVVQCSFLTWIHDRDSLAAAISQIFEKRAEGAPKDYQVTASPSQEAILGVLRACEEQTSVFEWRGLMLATASYLNLDGDVNSTIPPAIIRGAVMMFPMVQTLPEDREILIQTDQGVCALVVWAHHILGLNVLVKQSSVSPQHGSSFGSETPNLIIDVYPTTDALRMPSITLLEVSNQEPLFTIKMDHDEHRIDAISKQPAKGYGRRCLEASWREFADSSEERSGQEAGIQEMVLISTAFAMNLSRHICKNPRTELTNFSAAIDLDNGGDAREDSGSDSDSQSEDNMNMWSTYPLRIIDAARLLFNDRKLSMHSVMAYAKLFDGEPLYSIPPTRGICSIAEQNGYSTTLWQKTLLDPARKLSILTLAFSQIADLDSSAGLLLNHSLNVLLDADFRQFSERVKTWDGKFAIPTPEDVWFQVIALLMVGHKDTVNDSFLSKTSLLSDRGWTVFLSTIGDSDPTYINPGCLVVKRGVPYRNGVCKHTVTDGPIAWVPRERRLVREFEAGQTAPLHCGVLTRAGQPYCGEQGDSWVVNLRISTEHAGDKRTFTRRTGYREMFGAVWSMQKTRDCQHAHHSPTSEEKIAVPLNCRAVAIQGDIEIVKWQEKVIVFLTAHNKAARWRALIAIAWANQGARSPGVVLLRGKSCCFQCAIDQASSFAQRCFIVL